MMTLQVRVPVATVLCSVVLLQRAGVADCSALDGRAPGGWLWCEDLGACNSGERFVVVSAAKFRSAINSASRDRWSKREGAPKRHVANT